MPNKRSNAEEIELKTWWQQEQKRFRPYWDAHSDKKIALEEARAEEAYRGGELDKITQRTTLFVTTSGIILAVYSFLTTGKAAALTISKLGVVMTAVALISSLLAYMPPRTAWRSYFTPPEDWTALIQTDFDRFIQAHLRATRKSRPLDRYKRFHTVAVPSLITAIGLAVIAYILR